MSDEEQDVAAPASDEEYSEESEGKSKKPLILILAALLLLGGGGAGLYFSGMLDSVLGGAEEEHAEDEDGHGEEEDGHGDDHGGDDSHASADKHGSADSHGGGGDDHGGGPSSFVVIPTMIVNLNNTDGSSNYLRLSIQLELEDPNDAPTIEAVMPRVVDQFQTYLRELRPEDLRGSAGLYRLKMELLWRVNQAASPARVKSVLFQEMLLQ